MLVPRDLDPNLLLPKMLLSYNGGSWSTGFWSVKSRDFGSWITVKNAGSSKTWLFGVILG